MTIPPMTTAAILLGPIEAAAMSSKLHDLIALAQEPSSERRRDLLRGVTNLFFESDDLRGASELGLFDAVLTQLSGEMEEAVRAELAQRMARSSQPPLGLMSRLAQDEAIAVAGPVLRQSEGLSDEVLASVAENQSQDHLRAMSGRTDLTISLTNVIVARGDDETLKTLLANDRAELTRSSHETVVERAVENPDLHEAVVARGSLPPDLLNEMYFVVEARLRDQILARNAELDPGELDAALAAGRKQLASRDGALPSDYAEAEKVIRQLHLRGGITPQVLAGYLRNRQTTRFLLALCELADVDFHTARRILDRRDLDALSIVCKAADFDRSLYLTFAVLILDRDANAMGRAREYGDLYAALPRDAAQRTLRFWRLRRQTGDVAA